MKPINFDDGDGRHGRPLAALAATAVLYLPLIAHAQYTETIIYATDNSATVIGLSPSYPNAEVQTRFNVASINNSGEIALGATLFEPNEPGNPADDLYQSIVVYNDGVAANTIEILYQGAAAGAPCLLADSSRCLPVSTANAIINDNSDIAFLTAWANANPMFIGGEVAVHESEGTLSLLARSSDNGNGWTYESPTLVDFNNLGHVTGTFRTTCPDGTFEPVGYIEEPPFVSGPLGQATNVSPPTLTFFDECHDPSDAPYMLDWGPVLQPNGITSYFFGMRDNGGDPQTGTFATVGLVEVLLNRDYVTGYPISASDDPDILFIRERVGQNFETITDLVLIDYDAFGIWREIVIATTENGDWIQLNPYSKAINNTGTVAFVGEREAGQGIFVWAYDVATGNLTQVGGFAYTSRVLGDNSINDSGEIVMSGVSFQGNDVVVKFTPPPPPVPDIRVDRASINFGQVSINQTADETVTVDNIGTSTLTIASILSVGAASPFSVQNNQCGATLAAGASCSFDARYAPSVAGSDTGSIEIGSDDPDEPTTTITLAGTAMQPMPDINVRPSTDFGTLDVGQTLDEIFLVQNLGSDPLSISQIIAPLPPFFIRSDQCNAPVDIGPGEDCSLVIEFAPTVAGSFTERVEIVSNDPDESIVTTTLTGEAVDPPPTVVLSVVDSVDPPNDSGIPFGMLLVRDVGQQSFTVRNDGTDDVSLGLLALSGNATGEFSLPISGDGCSNATLAPAASCDVQVEFTSVAPGDFTATVDVPIASGGSLAIDLSATAALSIHDLRISNTASVSRVTAGSGETFEYTVRIDNDGPDRVREITVDYELPTDVSLVGQPSCTVAVDCFTDMAGTWTGRWTLMELAPMGSATATLMVSEAITGNPPGNCLESDASVIGEAGDTDTGNNSAIAVVGGGNCADLALTGQVSGVPQSETMASVTATATVTNNGPDDVAAVMVSGVADFGLGSAATVSVTSLTGCNNAAPTGEDSSYVCDAGPLASGGSMDITIEADVTSSTAFTVNFSVTASGSDDPDTSNNSEMASRQVSLQQPPAPTPTGSSSSSDCFVATAAYGSYLEPEVVVLRNFRDRWLLTNRPGRAFVDFYYRTSPPIANTIAGHEWLRLATRVLLTPLVYGVKHPLATLLVMLVGFAVGAWCRRHRIRARAV